MKRYVCRECPVHCTLHTNYIPEEPRYCVFTSLRSCWRPESTAESEAREEQEARKAMAVELRKTDEHF